MTYCFSKEREGSRWRKWRRGGREEVKVHLETDEKCGDAKHGKRKEKRKKDPKRKGGGRLVSDIYMSSALVDKFPNLHKYQKFARKCSKILGRTG